MGDEGDYAKLALLRVLAGDRQLGVNWYLTVHEEKPKKAPNASTTPQGDGHKRDHLEGGDEWAYLDAALLARMAESLRDLHETKRHISHLEALLPRTTFYRAGLPTGEVAIANRVTARARWHADALEALAECPIVFIDPDNGFEVRSRGPRSKWRCKYASYDEVADYLRRGQAVIAYQHQPRLQWPAAVTKVRGELIKHDVPTAPPGFIGFGSRGFFILHREASEIERLLTHAASLVPGQGITEMRGIAITVIAPAP